MSSANVRNVLRFEQFDMDRANIRPLGYRLEWKPGDYCYYTPNDYAREINVDGARIWALFAEPQPGCPSTTEVFLGWCWLRPKYAKGGLTLDGMTTREFMPANVV